MSVMSRWLRDFLSTVFDLDVRYIPMDDLMQLVWIKFVGVIRDKFDVSSPMATKEYTTRKNGSRTICAGGIT